jgi:hypothetical protein
VRKWQLVTGNWAAVWAWQGAAVAIQRQFGHLLGVVRAFNRALTVGYYPGRTVSGWSTTVQINLFSS